jgi:hypothetical protein
VSRSPRELMTRNACRAVAASRPQLRTNITRMRVPRLARGERPLRRPGRKRSQPRSVLRCASCRPRGATAGRARRPPTLTATRVPRRPAARERGGSSVGRRSAQLCGSELVPTQHSLRPVARGCSPQSSPTRSSRSSREPWRIRATSMPHPGRAAKGFFRAFSGLASLRRPGRRAAAYARARSRRPSIGPVAGALDGKVARTSLRGCEGTRSLDVRARQGAAQKAS